MVDLGVHANWIAAIILGVAYILILLRFRPKERPTGRGFVIANGLFIISGAFWGIFWLLFAVYSAGDGASMPVILAFLPMFAGGASTVVAISGQRAKGEPEPGIFTKLGAAANFVSKTWLFFGIAGITFAGVVSLPDFNVGIAEIFTVAVQPAKILPVLIFLGFIFANLMLIKVPKRVSEGYGVMANITDLLYWLFYGISISLLAADAPVWLLALPLVASFLSVTYSYWIHETWTILLGGFIGLILRSFILFALIGLLG